MECEDAGQTCRCRARGALEPGSRIAGVMLLLQKCVCRHDVGPLRLKIGIKGIAKKCEESDVRHSWH
jgi:hypothetical protein